MRIPWILLSFLISTPALAAVAPAYDVRIPELMDIQGYTAKGQWASLISEMPLHYDEQLAADDFVEQLDASRAAKMALDDPLAKRALALILAFQPHAGKENTVTGAQLQKIFESRLVNPARFPQLLSDLWVLMPHPGLKPIFGSLVNGMAEDTRSSATLAARKLNTFSVAAELYERNELKSILPKIDGRYVDMIVKRYTGDKILHIFYRSRPDQSSTESQRIADWVHRRFETATQAGYKLAIVFFGHYNDSLKKDIPADVELLHKSFGKRLIPIRH